MAENEQPGSSSAAANYHGTGAGSRSRSRSNTTTSNNPVGGGGRSRSNTTTSNNPFGGGGRSRSNTASTERDRRRWTVRVNESISTTTLEYLRKLESDTLDLIAAASADLVYLRKLESDTLNLLSGAAPQPTSDPPAAAATSPDYTGSGHTTPSLELKILTPDGTVADEDTSGEEPEPAPGEYPNGLRLAIIAIAVNLALFLAALDQTIVGTAIPKITAEFKGLGQVSWYGSAYFMCLGGFQCSWGKVYRFFPLKYTFITAVMLFEIGSLVCGVSQNSNTFIFGRAVAGVGGAGITTGVAVILALSAAPAKRPALMATMGLSYCIAFILGPLMGGIFSEKVTWRWCFYINLPIGSASIIMVWFFFHTPKSVKLEIAPWKEKLLHLDPVGIALVMGAITTFVLALESGGVKHPWNSSQVIGLLVGFVLMVAAFAVWEFVLQGDHAMLPRRLFKRRSLWAGSLFQFLFVGCYFLILFYLPIYFQSINGHSAVQSGVDTLPLVLTACVFIIVGGITVQKTRLATPYMAVGAAVTTVATGLFYTLDIGTPSARWIGFQILAAAGLAFPFQNVLNIVQAETDAEDISTATSSLYFFQILGGAFSVSAAQSAFLNRLIHSLTINAPELDRELVIHTGASDLRDVFNAEQLPLVLQGYMDGLKAVFAVGTGMVGVAFLVSFLSPWKRLYGNLGGMAVA